MKQFEKQIHSQAGQDGILQHIFEQIGTTNKFYLDIGAGNGMEISNTYNLRSQGWSGVCLDRSPGSSSWLSLGVHAENVTAENVEALCSKYLVPKEFDYLSIDIDGNDYWVWKALKKYSPRVVSIEFNSNFEADMAVTVPYSPMRKWDGTWYFGASLAALWKLGLNKEYELVHIVENLDAFFVRRDCLGSLTPLNPEDLLPVAIPCFEQCDRAWVKVR